MGRCFLTQIEIYQGWFLLCWHINRCHAVPKTSVTERQSKNTTTVQTRRGMRGEIRTVPRSRTTSRSQPPKNLREYVERLRPGGTKRRLVEFILQRPPGSVFKAKELEENSGGAIQWQRRLRELRDVGLPIYSHKDRAGLAMDEYLVASHDLTPNPKRLQRQIPAKLRQKVLNKQPYCGICGAVAGDPDPTRPGKTIKLEVDHKDPNGPTEEDNLWTLCNVCNHNRANLIAVDRDWITGEPLLAQLRVAPRLVKQKAYEYLKSYFGDC